MKQIALSLLFSFLVLTVHAETPKPKVQEILSTETTWNGDPLHYPTGTPKVTGVTVTIPVGGETGWHLHEVPNFCYILEGELVVYLKDGTSKSLKKGDPLSENVNTPHNGKNVGKEPVKIVVFYIGNTTLKNTIALP